MGFLGDLEQIVGDTYTNLAEVTLEHMMDDPKGDDVTSGNDTNRPVIGEKGFGVQLRGLETSFGRKGIQFRWIRRQLPPI